jgi:hypothetical protein
MFPAYCVKALEDFNNDKAPQGKTNVLQGMLGWNSVDDHMAAREADKFKELVAPIRSSIVPPTTHLTMFHAKLRTELPS